MKQSIEWHRDCLNNIQATLDREHEDLARKQKRVDRLEEDVEQYRRQIDRAQREGKADFDRERYKA